LTMEAGELNPLVGYIKISILRSPLLPRNWAILKLRAYLNLPRLAVSTVLYCNSS
jgi:hypothetical protein